jgi:hypothetical protein
MVPTPPSSERPLGGSDATGLTRPVVPSAVQELPDCQKLVVLAAVTG